MFDVNGTRLTPPKSLIKLEEHLGCWFDLSKTPLSNHRLIIEEQWQGLSDELLMRPNNGNFISIHLQLMELFAKKNIYI